MSQLIIQLRLTPPVRPACIKHALWKYVDGEEFCFGNVAIIHTIKR